MMRTLSFSLAFLIFASTFARADFVVPSDRVVSRVVVRESATSQSEDVGSLRPGDQPDYLGSVPRWYRIELADGTVGYVSKSWTRVVPDEATGSFTVDVVDVGTGLAVLIRGDNLAMLYDGGSNDDLERGNGNRLLAYLHHEVASLQDIDHMLLSHPHRDHVELLPDLFNSYQVDEVWDSGRVHTICGYRAFLTALRDEPNVRYHSALHTFQTVQLQFNAKRCYGVDLPAATLPIEHDSLIDNSPIQLAHGATMTFLYANGEQHASLNENSLVVRMDLADTRVLIMGDAEAGGRHPPSTPPTDSSIEGALLACCEEDLAADVLIVGHRGSMTSSRSAFLDAVGADIYVISSGPQVYGSVTLPDQVVATELASRGQIFRTDFDDPACLTNPAKIGPDNDDDAGGCDNVRISIDPGNVIQAIYHRTSD